MSGRAGRGTVDAVDRSRCLSVRGQTHQGLHRRRRHLPVELHVPAPLAVHGRPARVGSVAVSSLCDLERYPAQWQMTSTVAADVGAASLADIFAALFPSGSVTGAPKARSMEIIREVETSPRGIYTGAIGLIDPQ